MKKVFELIQAQIDPYIEIKKKPTKNLSYIKCIFQGLLRYTDVPHIILHTMAKFNKK